MSGSAPNSHDSHASQNEPRSTALHYCLHDTGIHEFRFLVPSHRAVDVWAEMLEAITRSTPPNATMRYIFDITEAGMIPFSHAYRRVQGVVRRVPERPRTRAAVIHPPNFMTGLVDAFNQLLHTDRLDVIRCFRVSEREQALAWLMEE